MKHTLLLTVVGPLLAVLSERGLLRMEFLREAYEYRTRVRSLAQDFADDDSEFEEDSGAFDFVVEQLGEYFCGRREKFDIPLDLRGSDFQLEVWDQLTRIPFGHLRSYQQIARVTGSPKASRAVGQATGHNPVAIVIPCHRVIASDGHLTGFGGGIELKARLLRLEGHTLGKTPRVVAPRLF